ncbi:hypothetical protein [Tepidiforma sp.]|uniref:hypothetical protein n=1 Tax=Tepidiforma sp. TaxID=2682230 RepID=UPI002ADE7E51|nr:hypothetical protein [Tepidiforma sp.]
MKRLLFFLSVASLLAMGAAAAAGCVDDRGSTGSGGSTPDYPTKIVDAPIDGIEVLIRETAPPQYAAVITSGLPSGCAQFAGWEIVQRTDREIVIRVTNRMPDSDEVACTMVYGTHESTVDLGSDFESGKTYTLVVNGTRHEFTAP